MLPPVLKLSVPPWVTVVSVLTVMFPTVVVANVARAAADPPNSTSLLAAQSLVKGPLALLPHTLPVQLPVVPAWFQYCVAALASLD